jgi:tRNA uridine 5-carbamoylmethylation protein Kti12
MNIFVPRNNKKYEKISFSCIVYLYRFEYQSREAELVKKNKKEVRRLNQAHDKEIQKMKKSYDQKIEDLRGITREKLSDKDQDNISKIESLRKIYADSMSKKVQEANDLREAQATTYENQIKNERQINEGQKNELKERKV